MPEKKTILKQAEALNIQARDLWLGIDVAAALDAVVSFQQSDYSMTAEEAKAFAETSKRNGPETDPSFPLSLAIFAVDHQLENSRVFTFQLDDDYGWDDDLICGGRMTVLAHPLRDNSHGAAADYYRTLFDLTDR